MAPHRSAEPWKSVFSYPDALYGIEWLVAASGGASLFSLEAYFQGYSSCDGAKPTPAFENVLLPLIRQIVRHHLIPDRTAVLSKIHAAYRPSSAAPRTLREDHLFTALYGPEHSTHDEWLPSTGRYYFIPVIPMLADASADKLFSAVIDDAFYGKHLADPIAKKKYFDGLYPAAGTGGAWFVNLGPNWLIANPNENKDTDADFEFPLPVNAGLRAKGALPPHTFGILREAPGRISMHLSNHRIDSGADVWNSEFLENGKPCDYVSNTYIANPSDSATRKSVFEIHGLTGDKPVVQVTAGKHGAYDSSWEQGVLTIVMDHNGTMDVEIEFER